MRTIAGALIAGLLLTGCGQDAAAQVGDHRISRADLDRELEAIAANPDYVSFLERASETRIRDGSGFIAEFVAQVLTAKITALVVSEEVRARGLEPTASERDDAQDEATASVRDGTVFARFRAWYRAELFGRATDRVVLRRALRGDETPRSYYDDHTDEFIRPCVQHILVATKQHAEAARGRIASGESFAAVARGVSIDEGSAPDGGDIGCNRPGDLVDALDEASFTLPIGEVSRPIRTDDGYNLILVTSREVRPFETVKGSAAGALERAAGKRLEALVRERLAGSDVDVTSAIGTWDGDEVVAS